MEFLLFPFIIVGIPGIILGVIMRALDRLIGSPILIVVGLLICGIVVFADLNRPSWGAGIITWLLVPGSLSALFGYGMFKLAETPKMRRNEKAVETEQR